MVSRRIDRAGICWPTEVVTNEAGEFVGYLMPRAGSTTMQKAMFVEPVLEKKFPNWQRWDSECRRDIHRPHQLPPQPQHHRRRYQSALNLLVTEDSTQLWIVDTDTFRSEVPLSSGNVQFHTAGNARP
jgi:hypothetical protein